MQEDNQTMSTTNPFSSRDRQHFPEFSPMFRKTCSSAERNSGFRWSIDHIARLKPAQIDTDAANLVKTNGHSPDSDHDTQTAVDSFFSQKTILPSPWPISRQRSAKTNKLSTLDVVEYDGEAKSPLPIQPKKVTFSPLPPATAFIRNDSLVESDMRDSGTVDAGTQTMLTFPMNFDLEKLLQGVAVPVLPPHTLTSSIEEDGRDMSNSSLRRKLFGQPERQGSSLSPSPTMENDKMQLSELQSPSKHSLAFNYTEEMGSAHHLQSPAIHLTKPSDGGSKEYNPAFSSLVLRSPMQQLPDLSPIGNDSQFQTVSSGDSKPGDERTKVSVVIPVTPRNKGCPSHIPAFNHQPRGGPLSAELMMSPIAAHSARPLTSMMSPVLCRKMENVGTGGSTCTSTPNNGVMKRQLIASPFASPVLKHPCTTRLDIDVEPISHDIKGNNCNIVDIGTSIEYQDVGDNDVMNNDNGALASSSERSSGEIAEPISLGDLRTETLELTNITATTCTSYFTNLDLEDNTRDPVTMDTRTGGQSDPLHSTEGDVPSSEASVWHPSHPQAHSTMVDSQFRINSNQPLPPGSFYPNLDPSSSVPGTSMGFGRPLSHTAGLVSSQFSSVDVDSGVATSVEFNPSVNMSSSKLIGEKVNPNEVSVSASQGVIGPATNDNRNVECLSVVDANLKEDVIEDVASYKTPRHLKQRHCRSKLSMIKEKRDDVRQTNVQCVPKSLLAPNTDSEMADSGLVFSPNVNSNLVRTSANTPMNKLECNHGETGPHCPVHTCSHPSSHHCGITTSSSVTSHRSRLPVRSHPISSSVLPSRLKLHSSIPSFSPSHYPQSTPGGAQTPSLLLYRGASSPRTEPSALRMSQLKPTSPAERLHVTPPSRYTAAKFVPSSHAGGQHLSGSAFPEEVLRKKKALKARLKFSSPIHSTAPLLPISGSHYGYMGGPKEHTSHSINSRVSTTRELLPGPSRSPLTSVTNKGYSPFSSTLLSPIRSSFLNNTSSATPISPRSSNKSPWKPFGQQQKENVDVRLMNHDSAIYTHRGL